MRFSVRAFAVGCIINILGLPVIVFFAVVGPMAAFGPNYDGRPPSSSVLASVWLAGTTLTRFVLDNTLYDGRMPERPSIGSTAGALAENPALARNWAHYGSELRKRNFTYQLSYAASPLLFGLVAGILYPVARSKKA